MKPVTLVNNQSKGEIKMDIRTATQMEKTRRQAIAIGVFLVVVMLGVATTFIAVSFLGGKPVPSAEYDPAVNAPNKPVITVAWGMPVDASAATILKAANFDMVQYNPTAAWYEYDLGYTIGAVKGTSVKTCYDGKVTSVVESGDTTTGKLVRIQHSDGLETVYSSLDQITVKVGDQVKKGEQIGTVGNTAHYENFSMPHVRLMAYQNGKVVNPEVYIDGLNADNK